MENITNTLKKLEKDEGYIPDYFMILQTTSPLREKQDIINCVNLMKKGGATTVLTIAPTHPKLYYLKRNNYIQLVNGSENHSSNTQSWPLAYLLNGCFVYLIKTKVMLKENRVITKKTKAIVCPKWRSVDVDTPEEWVMAEVLYKNKKHIDERLKKI